jgi:hypothetical protein
MMKHSLATELCDGGSLIRTVGAASCQVARAERDEYTDLQLTWDVDQRGQPLTLSVHGVSGGGYVTLGVWSETGALRRLTIVRMPPVVDVTTGLVSNPFDVVSHQVPRLDVGLWPWKRTPDYVEPARLWAEVAGVELVVHRVGEGVMVRFSSTAVSRRLRCGDVAVDVAGDGGLVAITASQIDTVSEIDG